MKTEFKIITDLIERNRKVLDVGCADGTLMKFLKDNKNINIRGMEISKSKVQECVAKGLTVIEGNAEKDLKQFPDKSFDYVILSQTLQAFLNPELVLDQLLRVGKKAIVTIPNFGYWKIRLHLLLKGTMPVTRTLPDEWYNTPNIHLCTIKDFVFFSKKKNFKLSKSIAMKSNKISYINKLNLNIKNLNSNLGIFLIEK
ncbi:methionine biosynthesis protein MetW [Candidatus Pelagibacter sp.]|nr:methionine biosynthesis protein MetW [Candidatus Pelagibacter sp.]